MHRDIDPKDFEGKTIQKLEADAVNIIRFYFTDGTSIAIETEGFGGGLVGMVSCTSCVDISDAGDESTFKARVSRLRSLLDEEIDDATGAARKPVAMSVLEEIHKLLEDIENGLTLA